MSETLGDVYFFLSLVCFGCYFVFVYHGVGITDVLTGAVLLVVGLFYSIAALTEWRFDHV